jgi:hypothetical protein
MLVVHKRSFSIGAVMALGFAAVLVSMFLPIVKGKTPLQSADDFFNSVSKDSSYYIPSLRAHAEAYRGAGVDLRLTLPDADSAAKVATVLRAAGAETSAAGAVTAVRGQLGPLIAAALDDSETMFHNRGDALAGTRGLPGRETMFAWWQALKQMNKQYRASGEFEKASAIEEVVAKGVEVSYNYYGIVPSPVSQNVGVLSLSLVFYLIYTMWWGYAIMWLCDGVGLQMKSAGKREH